MDKPVEDLDTLIGELDSQAEPRISEAVESVELFHHWASLVVRHGASDLFLTTDARPMIRINGALVRNTRPGARVDSCSASCGTGKTTTRAALVDAIDRPPKQA